MRIRFHWRLAQGGERAAASRALGSSAKAAGLPDLGSQVAFCRAAQEAGIDGLLLDIGAAKPDPVLLSAALGLATDKVGFIIAVRSGLLAPATFTQQINYPVGLDRRGPVAAQRCGRSFAGRVALLW